MLEADEKRREEQNEQDAEKQGAATTGLSAVDKARFGIEDPE